MEHLHLHTSLIQAGQGAGLPVLEQAMTLHHHAKLSLGGQINLDTLTLTTARLEAILPHIASD
jgi:hypothetical protein